MDDRNALLPFVLACAVGFCGATCGGLAVIDPDDVGTSSSTGGAGGVATTTSSATTSSTSTSTSNTTSSTSSTTSSVGCDEGDCLQCLAGACATTLCAAEIEACIGHAECVALEDCVDGCSSGDLSCVPHCMQSFAEGVAPLIAMRDCLYCRACRLDCDPLSCPYHL